jgi:RHS repeat-associated protein
VWDWEPDSFRPLAQTERAPLRGVPQKWVDEQFYAIVTDLIGTPTEMVDPDGNLAWHPQVTLWGTTRDRGKRSAYCPLRFPGQYFDDETQLNYNYYRYYDPGAGRYHASDPIGLDGGANPHAYVPNPMSWLDPLGLMSCPDKDALARQARNIVRRGRGPKEIDRIDPPNTSVPGSQWHAQRKGMGGPALNQDGTFRHGDPKFSMDTTKFLKKYGWEDPKGGS